MVWRYIHLVVSMLLFVVTTFASDIREFDVKTIERLGNELTQVSQTRDRGANTPVTKLARKTAIAALNGRMFNIRYDYVVLDDPDGSGFLVYALGSTKDPDDIVFCGHFRVTISADGEKAERVDPLSRSLLIANRRRSDLPKGTHKTGQYMTQIVSNKPVETLIYSASLTKQPIFVGTPNGKVWLVQNGRISVDKSKPGSDTMGGAARAGIDNVKNAHQ